MANKDLTAQNDINETESPYNLYNPLNPDCVMERIRYRQETREKRNSGRDIHGSPIRISSVYLGVEESRACCCAEWTLICVLICVVWILMMIPTAFYIKTYLEIAGNADNQLQVNNTVGGNSTEANGTVCSPVEYKGDVCAPSLLLYQNCVTGHGSSDGSTAYISSDVDQSFWESRASRLSIFQGSISAECKVKLIPFLCLHFFKLCNNETRTVVKPSLEQCVEVRDKVCSDALKLLIKFVPSDLIPDCESFPHNKLVDTCNSSQSQNQGPHGTCVDHFYYSQESQRCLPQCAVWSPYSQSTVRISDVFTIVVSVFAIITGTVVLVLSCIRCKRVFVFPTILIVYQTFSILVIAVVVLIGYTARSTLFCSSKNLMDSIFKPTPFCILSGVILYYILTQLLLLWVFQVAFVFWGTWWPIHARQFMLSGKGHCVHAIMLQLALFLPVIPVVVVGVKRGFTLTRIPPILCAGPHIGANFFSMILPSSIVIACGVSLIILIMRIVIKKHIVAKIRGHRLKLSWWSSEIKLLIVLCYYILLGVVALTTFTIAMADLGEFTSEVTKYFECEGRPQFENDINNNSTTNSTTCDRESVERLVNPIPTTVAFVLIGIYPAVNLVYTWNYKELKQKWKSRQVQYVDRPSSNRFSREEVRATIRHMYSFSSAPQ